MTFLSESVCEADDLRFVSLADELITGVVAHHRFPEVLIFKIDHWFSHKWLGFSGKVVGAIGSWRTPLTIPPFVANRIVDHRRYVRDAVEDEYLLTGSAPQVHHVGPSTGNLRRYVTEVVGGAALFWYSGDTAAMGRGSFMAYVPVEDEYWPWYVSFDRSEDWRIGRKKGVYDYELRRFEEACRALRSTG